MLHRLGSAVFGNTPSDRPPPLPGRWDPVRREQRPRIMLISFPCHSRFGLHWDGLATVFTRCRSGRKTFIHRLLRLPTAKRSSTGSDSKVTFPMTLRSISPWLASLAFVSLTSACGETPPIYYYAETEAEEDDDDEDDEGGRRRPTTNADEGPMNATTDSDTGMADTGPPPTAPPTAPGGFYVVGTQIFDYSGDPIVFHGVARPSLEWQSQGDNLSAVDYGNMALWGANVVRIALNQGFWLPGSAQYDAGYQARISQQITWAEAAGMAVILDLHWSDRGNPAGPTEQQRMADARSIQFWQSVATLYQGDGQVIFELYNEPHDIDWSVWRNGGPSGEGWNAVGMQQLYDTVRAAGANNLVIVGGLDFAYDLSGLSNPSTVLQGYNIVYATHPYDIAVNGQRYKQPDDWARAFGTVHLRYPLIATEFGTFDCSTGYVTQFLNYAAMYDISWTAWAWYPASCEFPSIITDWNGTPTQVGVVVRSAM